AGGGRGRGGMCGGGGTPRVAAGGGGRRRRGLDRGGNPPLAILDLGVIGGIDQADAVIGVVRRTRLEVEIEQAAVHRPSGDRRQRLPYLRVRADGGVFLPGRVRCGNRIGVHEGLAVGTD